MQIDVIAAEVASTSQMFSPALCAGNFVFVSGQASLDEAGAIVRDGFEGEMRRSLANLERVLRAAGLGLENIVQVRAYLDDAGNLAEYNRIYREQFSDPLPARTTLIGCLGGFISFEIDAIACVDATR